MPVCVIYSGMCLSAIREFLLTFGPTDKVGTMRINYDRDGFETDRTICVLDQTIFDKAVAAGFDKRKTGIDFSVAAYRLGDRNYPREGFTSNFYLPLPRELELTETLIIKQVETKIKQLVTFGDLPAACYKITIPKVSRETGALRGSCFVSFQPNVPLTAIATTRVALDSTAWDDAKGQHEESRCFWAFDNQKAKVNAVPKDGVQIKRRAV